MDGPRRSIEDIGADLTASPDSVEVFRELPPDEQSAVRRAVLPTHEGLEATTEEVEAEDPEVFGTE